MANDDLQPIHHVPGYCDTCGHPTLIRSADSTVSCSYADCPTRVWRLQSGLAQRLVRTVRCLARDLRACWDAALDRLTERVDLADTARRTRRSDAYKRAAKALFNDPSLPIPEDRRFDALLAFERLVDQGVDVPTAYSTVIDEEW
jgi:hypothetical protein